MPKKLALNQILVDRSAIDADEWPVFKLRSLVDRSGNHILAGSIFTGNKRCLIFGPVTIDKLADRNKVAESSRHPVG